MDLQKPIEPDIGHSPGGAPVPPVSMVSIILCTRNRAGSLDETLTSMQEVAVPPGLLVELILVDNGSTDATGAVIERHRDHRSPIQLRAMVEPAAGKSRALNAGVKAARGEILLFTDDDVRFPANWVGAMVAPVLAGAADVVQGGIRWSTELLGRVPAGSFLPRMVASTPHKHAEELRTALIGANMAIRRDAVLAAGLFDEALGPGAIGLGEETLLAYKLERLGYRKGFALDVEVEHHFDPGRLTPAGIAAMANSKGRSLGYIDYHWNHVPPARSPWIRIALHGKLLVRTLATPAAWPGAAWMPEWKFSYLASLARLRQMRHEAEHPPKYPRPVEATAPP